ncbi:MAG: hypothetical protein BWY67_01124 [Bacteroidetes bacterium ADurb.Bin397]|nr:MAG: hypothetical protein BWY67_01124 [Bacteroidetes bacterium ADurb.Bin397]
MGAQETIAGFVKGIIPGSTPPTTTGCAEDSPFTNKKLTIRVFFMGL